MFVYSSGGEGSTQRVAVAGGTAGVRFNEIHLSALFSVLQRGNSERFYELIRVFLKKYESSAMKITPLRSRPRPFSHQAGHENACVFRSQRLCLQFQLGMKCSVRQFVVDHVF